MTRKRDESEVAREAAAGYGVTEEGDVVSPTGEGWDAER